MERRQLNVESRTETGKNVNNRLRAAGYIPAVLYSHGTAEAIKIVEKDFFKLFKGHVSESIIFDLNFKDKGSSDEYQAFVKDYQKHPVTDEVMHLDLFKVTKGEKIQTRIPVEVVGTSIGVKRGATMEIYNREIVVECLPMNLPEKVQVDVSEMVEGNAKHARDIVLAEGVKLISNPDEVIVSVHVTRVTAETEAAEGAAEGEAAGEAAEGESEE